MICYRDKTFCPFYKECKKGEDCPDALTEKIERGAKEWWWKEDEPPIAQWAEKPECFA